jgi:hypothetical protein
MNINKLFYFTAGFLLTVIIIVVFLGDNTVPKVKSVKIPSVVSPYLEQVSFDFNRKMSKQTVQEGFQISPKVEGKFAWIGNKLAYTFTQSLDYNTTYTITITGTDLDGKILAPFTKELKTNQREIFYLKSQNDSSVLVLKNIDSKQEQELTDSNLFVTSYKYSKANDAVYFFASDLTELKQDSFITDYQKLYSYNLSNNRLKLISDSDKFVNFSFDVAPDGSYLALVRAKKTRDKILSERGLFILDLNSKFSKFEEFWFQNIVENQVIFSPDSKGILGVDFNLGFVLVPLAPDLTKLVEFGLHKSSTGFSSNGRNLLFLTNKDQSGKNNLITIFKEQNSKTQFGKDKSSNFEMPHILNNGKQIAYLNKNQNDSYSFYLSKDLSNLLPQFSLADTSLNYEFYSISSNDKYLIIEEYPNVLDSNYGPAARDFIESFNNALEPANFVVVNLSTGSKEVVNIQGRKPTWRY